MVAPAQGALLHALHRRIRPELSIEIGLGYGFSTLFFLAAVAATGRGHHIAIDPFQQRDWHAIGVTHVKDLGLDDRFSLIEDDSSRALGRLASEGRRAQLFYVDGYHLFDSILIDFALSAPLCDRGALIVLDDTWMPSTRKVVSFIESNRKDFRRDRSPVGNVAIFRKLRRDHRRWDHFVDF